ncbi:MAG: DUF4416 family protein [Syntrophales bacterium]|jgi:hypothetical protein|nr:DUF4416 family protein [Syntrophales bacterium]MCK9527726.1 DUF4416 family protein [Syntrophales bacterium]MDX9921619.1 DUF4416 family protein [Syntrophales bacterium]
MSLLSRPDPVKLVASMIFRESDWVTRAIDGMSDVYGKPDYISTVMPFDYTDYYTAEMGAGLKRRVVSFESLISPDGLPAVKKSTNGVEAALSRKDRRRVNIDPGCLSTGHLLLATGKPYAHRPYLGDGVYGDLTLIYRGGFFQELPWTYPDYREPSMISMLARIREKYLKQLAAVKRNPEETA